MPYLRLLLPTLVFLLVAHGAQVYAPHTVDPGFGADGIKNLYTFAWYSAHNDAVGNFEGMAAPYGEHILYTDQTPLISVLWRWPAQLLGIGHWSAPLLMLLIHLSWLLTPFPLFKILRRFGVSTNVAVAGAVGYALLAPQVARATGHYALSFTLVIPLAWWLALRVIDRPNLRRMLVLTLLNAAALFVHAYLGMIAIAFTALVLGFNWLFFGGMDGGRFTQRRGVLIAAFVTSLLPMAGFLAVLKLTDVHPCRMPEPYGFFEFTSSIGALLFPQVGPYSSVTRALRLQSGWEGHAYIGVSAALVVVSFPLWAALRPKLWFSPALRELLPALAAAVLLFVIACGQPFAALGEESLNAIPFLRDFRGIGRFAWPLYFVLTAAAVVVIDKVFATSAPAVGRSLVLGFFLLLVGEAAFLHGQQRRERSGEAHPLFRPDAEAQAALNALGDRQYAAIIPLPFFHLGSEVFAREPDALTERTAMGLAFHSGIPLLGAHLTRASITETRALLAFFAPEGYDNPLAAHFKPDDRFVLVAHPTKQPDASFVGCETCRAWGIAEPVYSGTTLVVKTIRASELLQPKKNAIDPSERIAHDPLDGVADANAVSNGAVRRVQCDDYTVLFSARPDSSWLNRPMLASVWVRANDLCAGEQHGLNAYFVVQTRTGEQTDWPHYSTPKMALRHRGDWVQVTGAFTLSALPDTLDVFIRGEDRCGESLVIDDFELHAAPLTSME
ncbi:MAG: hypothetical protein ACFCUH_01095 [Flavobacteriales bacterium]